MIKADVSSKWPFKHKYNIVCIISKLKKVSSSDQEIIKSCQIRVLDSCFTPRCHKQKEKSKESFVFWKKLKECYSNSLWLVLGVGELIAFQFWITVFLYIIQGSWVTAEFLWVLYESLFIPAFRLKNTAAITLQRAGFWLSV